jgi:hypothetical protein
LPLETSATQQLDNNSIQMRALADDFSPLIDLQEYRDLISIRNESNASNIDQGLKEFAR